MSIKLLQEKIGAKPDGVFGPGTMKAAMVYYKMSPERTAHFFGQTSHETGGLKIFSENLNYNVKGLLSIFKKYFFTSSIASSYALQPEKIANRVYASRMGNGDETSGDGWKYRGRGALQLTGKDNYKAFSVYIKDPEILTNPDLVTSKYAFESAMFFFDKNKLWSICDKGVNKIIITELTKKINGGINGLEDRVQKTGAYYEHLK